MDRLEYSRIEIKEGPKIPVQGLPLDIVSFGRKEMGPVLSGGELPGVKFTPKKTAMGPPPPDNKPSFTPLVIIVLLVLVYLWLK